MLTDAVQLVNCSKSPDRKQRSSCGQWLWLSVDMLIGHHSLFLCVCLSVYVCVCLCVCLCVCVHRAVRSAVEHDTSPRLLGGWSCGFATHLCPLCPVGRAYCCHPAGHGGTLGVPAHPASPLVSPSLFLCLYRVAKLKPLLLTLLEHLKEYA